MHVVTIAVDSFLPFSLGQLVIPFTATYRPLWTGLGIGAAELLLALAITNHYRKRMPYRFWRSAHYLNFVVWTAASVHGVFSGTDRSAAWLVLIYAIAIGTVVALLAWRFGRYALRSRPVALGGVGAFALLPLLLLCSAIAEDTARLERSTLLGPAHRSGDPQRDEYEADRLLHRQLAVAAEVARAR